MPDDEDIDDLPAAPAAPMEATLPKGGGLALDLLIEQAEEWREKSGKTLPAEIGSITLTGEKPEGNFILQVPAEPAAVTVRIKWWKDRNRWTPTCTCGQYKIHRSCGHIGPAARALRGMATAAKGDALAKPTASSFAEEIAARAGRKLTPAEWKKIDGLHHCHQGFLKTGEISPWDLARAGWLPYHVTVSGQAFPAGLALDIRDFWLCLAAEHRRLRLPIPDFMEPFSDPALASPTLVDFHASRERRTWQDWMDHHASGAVTGGTEEEATETDHRLRVENMHVHLEWSAGPEAAFKAIRETDARRLLQGGADGGLPRLNAEGLLVLRMLQSDGFSSRSTLSLASSRDLRILAQILSFPFMRDRLCDEGGDPLPRHPGRLTWHLIAPAEGGADYRFELRTPDGDVLDREIIAVLPGPPVQYLAADGLRAGPPPLPEMHGGVVRVPAAVMESRVGLRLARRAGVEPPAAVARRVRVLRPRVVVKAWLGPDPRNRHGMETCWLDASATFPDQPGRSERLGGWGWTSASATPRAPGDDFTEHDDHILRLTRDWITEGGHIHDRSTQYWRRASMPVSFAEKFHAWLQLKPAGVELDLQGDLASFLDGEVRESLRVVVTPADQPDWFDLLVARDITDNLLTPAELDALRAAEGGWTRLPNGKWRRLVTEGGEDAEEALARLGLDGRESGTVRAHALQLAGAARGLLSEEDAESARRQAAAVRLRVTPEPPADLKAELRPYQREGYHFLCYLAENGFGGVLADDMGLGKTVQTLAWLLHLRATAGKKAPPSLVVCPKSVVENWTAEAHRFAPALRVRAWRGSELDRFAAEAGAADLHVLNYAQLRLLDGRWPAGGLLALVLDEAQAVKNPDSDSARAARAVKARHRLALTGTPIENRLLDLWSILNITMPGALPGRAEFGRRFNVKTDPHARLRLSARVRPFLLRRAKAQVATDLPERVEKDLLCVMEGEQHDLYQAELKTARSILLNLKIAKDLDRERFNILTSMLRLRQICCSPRLVNPNAGGDGAKLEALRDQLEPLLEEGQKVLVFSQFTGVLDLIGAMLEREFPASPRFRLDGSTENRGELVAEFQKTAGAAVFLLSLKAGGFGLNLTAASTVILYDPWWNPAVEAQAIDRTHRIGQRNQVLACRLIAKDSIEEKIRQLQTAKKSLAADVLGEEAFSKSLTLDDFAFLFAEGKTDDQTGD